VHPLQRRLGPAHSGSPVSQQSPARFIGKQCHIPPMPAYWS
jgi:hypothetical protein